MRASDLAPFRSSCKICPPHDGTVDGCVKGAVSTWVDANQTELGAH